MIDIIRKVATHHRGAAVVGGAVQHDCDVTDDCWLGVGPGQRDPMDPRPAGRLG